MSAPESGFIDAFKKHGLLGLITGAHLLLIFYLVSTFNKTIQESTVVMRELKALIERNEK